jgi:hypothetical protein
VGETLDRVLEKIEALHPKAQREYMKRVARGVRALSGSDIKGKARNFGAEYYGYRMRVAALWIDAGGHIRRMRNGRLVLEEGPPPESAMLGTGCALRLPVWEWPGDYTTCLRKLPEEQRIALKIISEDFRSREKEAPQGMRG